ncbi:MAG: hypothetical protein H6773_00100 [Pseudomonadales bacterium]|nr:hypothetical protein [Pseudomonadales bacterium]
MRKSLIAKTAHFPTLLKKKLGFVLNALQPPKRLPNWAPTFVVTAYFLGWFSYFFYFWANAIIINNEGGISAQMVNLWGDWAAHFTMGSAMAERGLLLTTSPFLLNASFSYPFVADMISAVLIRMHLDFFMAFVLPSFVFSCLFVIALFVFYKQLLKSVVLALLASTIFLFNGGTGFVYYFKDVAESPNKIETALNPPRDYTNMEELHYRWISVITSMVMPQRAFTLGFPVTLLLLTIILKYSEEEEKSATEHPLKIFLKKLISKPANQLNRRTWFFASAAIAGILPIIHTHSFLVLFIVLAFWSLRDVVLANGRSARVRALLDWTIFAFITACVALPLLSIFILNNVHSSFIKWYPGWYVGNDYPTETLLSFWFKNWSVVPLLTLGGLITASLSPKKNIQKLYQLFTHAPFIILFILTNLVLFQPFVWDNTKILVWASVGFAALTAVFLHTLWQKHTLIKPLVIALTIIICLSGFLDVFRAIKFDLHSYQMYSAEELTLAAWTKENTPADSIWLTGTYHNQWMFNLTGRQALATYTGWLWTHGYDYNQEERAVRNIYYNPVLNRATLDFYHIDYIVVGPVERREFLTDPQLFNVAFFENVYQTDNYTIFKYLRSRPKVP